METLTSESSLSVIIASAKTPTAALIYLSSKNFKLFFNLIFDFSLFYTSVFRSAQRL
eukprot:m.202002 g.202002  ORF g.202002 m.202002 type:complete len:57 (+) comp39601_c1_seq23:2030-2200(+)